MVKGKIQQYPLCWRSAPEQHVSPGCGDLGGDPGGRAREIKSHAFTVMRKSYGLPDKHKHVWSTCFYFFYVMMMCKLKRKEFKNMHCVSGKDHYKSQISNLHTYFLISSFVLSTLKIELSRVHFFYRCTFNDWNDCIIIIRIFFFM